MCTLYQIMYALTSFREWSVPDSGLGAFHLVCTHLGRRGGGDQASYTFPLGITSKKGVSGSR